ncbi:hypothetical protein [Collimonas antrihumi]|uniref:hypothetical protein n=1 Tax=Collimonas antrihumi TaxID=1940615 RepID=UPI001B8B52B5|nr:hypothetical protein [Collimonas antrihumi]
MLLILLIVLDPVIAIAVTPTVLPPAGVAGPYSTWFPSGQTGYVTGVAESSYISGPDLKAAKLAKTMINAGLSGPVEVAVTAEATVGADAIAVRAGAMAVPVVGQVITVVATTYQLAQMLKDAGYRYGNCQNPGLVVGPGQGYCKPDPKNPPQVTSGWIAADIGTATKFSSGQAACDADKIHNGWGFSPTFVVETPDPGQTAAGSCKYQGAGSQLSIVYTADAPSTPGGFLPATADDVAGAVKLKMIADSNARKALFDAMRADATGTQQPDTLPPLYPATSPVTVTAPPVTSPASSPSIQTIPKPDGSIDTVKTTEQTTVTPTTTGTTVGDTKTTFPSTTTTTTTTTNNVTNQTTTSTNVVNNPPALPQFPNDYNKEVTQQQIERDLNTDSAQAMPDQQKVITDAGTQGDTDRDKIYTDIKSGQQDKSAWFSWVWSPPVGVCSPITGTIAGFHVEWDLCPSIAIIQAIIGWLLAIFSGAEVYGQLFRRED